MKRQHHTTKHAHEGDLDYEEWHAAISRHWEKKSAQLRARRTRKLRNMYRHDHTIFDAS